MLNKLYTTNKILFGIAFSPLIYSEKLDFNGSVSSAIFLGIWMPYILEFVICLKLMKSIKNSMIDFIRFSEEIVTAFVLNSFLLTVARGQRKITLNQII